MSCLFGTKCLPCTPLSFAIIKISTRSQTEGVWARSFEQVLLSVGVFHGVKDIQSFFSPQSFLSLLVPKPRHHIFPRFEICARIWWANDKIIYSKNNVIFFYKLSVLIIFIPFLFFMIPHYCHPFPIYCLFCISCLIAYFGEVISLLLRNEGRGGGCNYENRETILKNYSRLWRKPNAT